MQLRSLFELVDAEINHFDDGLDLFKVGERSAFQQFFAIWYVDEKEWRLRVKEHFLRVTLVAASDPVVVEERVWHRHESLVHTILRVQERVRVASLDQS